MYKDRVYETSISTGTGAFTLDGAVIGYRTFTSTFGTTAAYYTIVNRDNPAQWEIGSFTVSGTTLTRTAANVISGSSGSGVLVNFAAGTKDVFNSPPAARMTAWDQGGVTVGGSVSFTSHTGAYLAMSGKTISLLPTGTNCNCNCNCYC